MSFPKNRLFEKLLTIVQVRSILTSKSQYRGIQRNCQLSYIILRIIGKVDEIEKRTFKTSFITKEQNFTRVSCICQWNYTVISRYKTISLEFRNTIDTHTLSLSLTLSFFLFLTINFERSMEAHISGSRICSFYLYDGLAEDRGVTRKISWNKHPSY